MMFRGLKTRDAKKKLLGVLITIAFVAFFASIATRYIVISEIDLTTVAMIAISVIAILLLILSLRKRKKKSLRKKRR